MSIADIVKETLIYDTLKEIVENPAEKKNNAANADTIKERNFGH